MADMGRAETFALILIILCVAALGIGVIVEASKYALLRSRRTVTQGKLERRRQELEAAAKRADEKEDEAAKLAKRLDSLNADRQKTLSLIKTVQVDRIEMVHELGAVDRSRGCYETPLTPTADFNRMEERRIMFHRDIWKRRNSALIWADSFDEAEAALARVFAVRSAVQYGKPKPHPELSKIPGSETR
jgi:hypothetical protein